MVLKFTLFFILVFGVFDFLSGDDVFQERYNQDIGCFSFNYTNYQRNEPASAWSMTKCVERCLKDFYRYAGVMNATVCYCGSELNTQGPSICNIPCYQNTEEICGGPNAISIRSTGYLVPGPPDNVKEINITENVIGLKWKEPRAPNGNILLYQIEAVGLQTYSSEITVLPRSWSYSGNTTKAELLGLHAGTMYNISISAKNSNGPGKAVFHSVWTEIGEPPVPDVPEVIKTENNTITLHLKPIQNENGPVTAYRIVISSNIGRLFTHEELKSWSSAQAEGSPFYVAAELKPEEISGDFIVGDGKQYGEFFNAPLSSTRDYHVSLGIISTSAEIKTLTKTSYSNFTSLVKRDSAGPIFDTETDNDGGDFLNIILTTAIIISALVLVLLVTAYIYLRIKLGKRVRPRNLQEMVLRGPFIDMDNNAFVDDDEENEAPVQNGLNEHFKSEVDDLNGVGGCNTKRKPAFPLSSNGVFTLVGFVDKFIIDPTYSMVFEGQYGPIYECTARKPPSCNIFQGLTLKIEGELINDEKLLHDLFMHTFCKHRNIIQILGIHIEPKSTYYIVMEHFGQSLKHVLLQYRSAITKNVNSSCEKIEHFLQISIGIGEGLLHLHSREVMHYRLCARSILIENGNIPKICNFGVTSTKQPEKQYYARWQPPNQFRRSSEEESFCEEIDVWSFGVLLWEIFALGGTPYIHLSNEDVSHDKFRTHLPRIDYIPDSLNELMKNCWLDPMEQLKLEDIIIELNKMVLSEVSKDRLPSSTNDLTNVPFNVTVEGYSSDDLATFDTAKHLL